MVLCVCVDWICMGEWVVGWDNGVVGGRLHRYSAESLIKER